MLTRIFIFIGWIVCLSLSVGVVKAQSGDVVVPDITGLSVPQAAALLNRAGLRLGTEISQGWTAESGLAENRIYDQSIAPDQPVPPGTAVDVNVLRSPNATLIYDDNDLSLLNSTGGELNLAAISFVTVDGTGAQLAASRWSSSLRPNQCVQVWSVGRNGPKGLPECQVIQNWLVTTNAAEHFWTGAGGTTQFSILQNGIPRGTCPVANPGRCSFFLQGGSTGGDSADFVYFAYTPDRLAIINPSSDQWMVLDGLMLINNATPLPRLSLFPAETGLYGRNAPTLASVSRLAPGQCILYTNSVPESDTPPQPCDVIARLDIGTDLIFWGAEFGVVSSDGTERTCPVYAAGRLLICVMPR